MTPPYYTQQLAKPTKLSLLVSFSSEAWPRNSGGRFGNLADLSEPILSAICLVLVIILGDRTTRKREMEIPDKT